MGGEKGLASCITEEWVRKILSIILSKSLHKLTNVTVVPLQKGDCESCLHKTCRAVALAYVGHVAL